MPKERILFEGYMIKEGLKINLQHIDLETKEVKGPVSVSLPPEWLDELTKKWQAFKDGTSEDHLLMYRNYFDDVPQLDYSEAMRLQDEHQKKGKRHG